MSERLPEVADLAAELRELELATQPWELHGALAGWIAGGGQINRRWVADVLADPALADVVEGSALEALGKATFAQMQDSSLGFELLMPDEDASLEIRSGALFDWCRHFLGAFGLAAGAQPKLSADGEEALEDLAQLATATAEPEGDEEDEAAFTEIEEFVRVAALLLHGDCALAQQHRNRLH
ncbi:UPF0149 family protein [Lysobacter soyae]|uniref:UPF0149 family protein n=1 Tax=Lysobacter soyae TaxID=2764185 RepID=A0ABX8WPA8_9GAMM|nr:UPF0149 family protein [Lysobacter sp. CJ11]QYR52851.1 UPF0149 family protein [Lysobacter sp. CJ11]